MLSLLSTSGFSTASVNNEVSQNSTCFSESKVCAADGFSLPDPGPGVVYALFNGLSNSRTTLWNERFQIYPLAPHLPPCAIDHIVEFFLNRATSVSLEKNDFPLFPLPLMEEDHLNTSRLNKTIQLLKLSFPTHHNYTALQNKLHSVANRTELIAIDAELFPLDMFRMFSETGINSSTLTQFYCADRPVDPECSAKVISDLFVRDSNLEHKFNTERSIYCSFIELQKELFATVSNIENRQFMEQIVNIFGDDVLISITTEKLTPHLESLDGNPFLPLLLKLLQLLPKIDLNHTEYDQICKFMFSAARSISIMLNNKIAAHPELKDPLVKAIYEGRKILAEKLQKELERKQNDRDLENDSGYDLSESFPYFAVALSFLTVLDVRL